MERSIEQHHERTPYEKAVKMLEDMEKTIAGIRSQLSHPEAADIHQVLRGTIGDLEKQTERLRGMLGMEPERRDDPLDTIN